MSTKNIDPDIDDTQDQAKKILSKIRKQLSNKKRYALTREISNKALINDRILAANYPHSQGKTPIAIELLQDADFEFDIVYRIERSNPPVFWIINHGYSYTPDKKKLIIHYGNNPLYDGKDA